MSVLSKITGIGINPLKGKVKIDPLKAVGTGLALGTFGIGPLAGTAAKIGSAIGLGSKLPTKSGAYNPENDPDLQDPFRLPNDSSGGILDRFRPVTDAVKTGRKALGLGPLTLGNIAGGAKGLVTGSDGGLDLSKILNLGAGAEGIYNTIEANKLRGKALDAATSNYNARAPLRTQGLSMLTNVQRPDLSQTFQAASNNPYSSRYRKVG